MTDRSTLYLVSPESLGSWFGHFTDLRPDDTVLHIGEQSELDTARILAEGGSSGAVMLPRLDWLALVLGTLAPSLAALILWRALGRIPETYREALIACVVWPVAGLLTLFLIPNARSRSSVACLTVTGAAAVTGPEAAMGVAPTSAASAGAARQRNRPKAQTV